MPNSQLKNQLFRLLELLHSEYEEWAYINGLSEEKTLYKKVEAVDYEYPAWAKVTDINYPKIYKKLNKYQEFLQKIEMTEEYNNSLECLKNAYKLSEKSARSDLLQFIHKSLRCFITESVPDFDESFFTMLINVYINERELLPIDHNFKIFLGGIMLKEEHYDLSNDVCRKMVIRRPDLSDMWLEWKYSPEYTYHNDFIPVEATAILEFTYPCNAPKDTDDVTEGMYNILLLHRVSSITNLRVDQEIKYSFLKWDAPGTCMSYNMYRDRPNLKYEYTDDDIERLRILIECLHPNIGIIKTNLDRKKKSNDFGYLEYAFVMYKEALLQHANIRIRIAFVVTALETVFKVKDEYIARNGRRVPNYLVVGKRLTSLLMAKGYESDNFSDIVSKAYRIRDAMYHGFDISPEILNDEEIIYKSMLDYLRVSLQILIQLKLQKSVLIKQIDGLDKAQKYRSSKKDLRAILQKEIFIS